MTIYINGDSGITDVNGTAAAPAITGTDTDTGVYFGTNTLGLSTNGTNGLYMDSSQNVGIGTTSPSAPTTVKGRSADGLGIRLLPPATTTAYNSIQWTDDPVTQEYSAILGDTSKNLIFRTNSANERMRIDSSGNVMVGTTSTVGSARFTVYAASATGIGLQTTGTNDGIYGLYNTSGTTSNNVYVMPCRFGSTNTFKGGIYYNGTTGLMEYTGTSDYRTKENIIDAPAQLESISKIKVREFLVKGSTQRVIGFVAHELQECIPVAVTGEKDAIDENGEEILQTVNQQALIPILVKSIQELKSIVDAQQQEIELLKAKQ